MRLFPRRRTAPPAETRGPVIEALALAGPQTPASGGGDSGRMTYPSSDPEMQAQVKRYDVASRARKITLYQTYLGEAAISACVEAIAARLISGGWTLTPSDPKRPNLTTRAPLDEFWNWCNLVDNANQIIHDMAQDLLWAGECYSELTWKPSLALGRTVPYEIFPVDVISMDYTLAPDKKEISAYVQTTDTGNRIDLSLEQIVRIWFPDPRNRLRALSPIEKLLNPTTWDTYLQLSEQKYFEQGNRGDVWIDAGGDENLAGRLNKWVQERFLGVKNAHRPLVTFGGAKVATIGNRSALDVLGRRTFARQEIMGVYKVPPQMLSLIEAGNVGGGGTAEVMEKQFRHTAVDPIRQRMMEALNFRITVQGFGVTDWTLDTVYADLRDSQEVDAIQANKVKTGRLTINEARAEERRDPVPGGDQSVLILTREIVPVHELDNMVSSQKLAVQQAALKAATPAGGQAGSAGVGQSDDGGDSSERMPDPGDTLSEAQRRELTLWERVAIKRTRKGEPPKPWASETLPAATVNRINERLATARTALAVREAFDAMPVEDRLTQADVPDWLKAEIRATLGQLAGHAERQQERLTAALALDGER